MKAGIIGFGRMGAFTSQAVKSHASQCWFPLNHAESNKIEKISFQKDR